MGCSCRVHGSPNQFASAFLERGTWMCYAACKSCFSCLFLLCIVFVHKFSVSMHKLCLCLVLYCLFVFLCVVVFVFWFVWGTLYISVQSPDLDGYKFKRGCPEKLTLVYACFCCRITHIHTYAFSCQASTFFLGCCTHLKKCGGPVANVWRSSCFEAFLSTWTFLPCRF